MKTMLPRTCRECSKSFSVTLGAANQGEGVFCSRACYDRHRSSTDEERFWKRVKKTADCWLWIGSVGPKGYGRIYTNAGKEVNVHRLSYKIHFGSIPDNMLVCHHCDNKLCVRPDHLFLGTHADNTHDMLRKGRHGSATHPGWGVGAKNANAKLTEAQVREIRARYAAGGITQYALADEYHVPRALIGQIIRRVRWSHL